MDNELYSKVKCFQQVIKQTCGIVEESFLQVLIKEDRLIKYMRLRCTMLCPFPVPLTMKISFKRIFLGMLVY